jgi:hypothetical protein
MAGTQASGSDAVLRTALPGHDGTPELSYGGVMNDQAAPVPQKQPVVILTTPRLILRTATEPDIPIMWQRIWATAM